MTQKCVFHNRDIFKFIRLKHITIYCTAFQYSPIRGWCNKFCCVRNTCQSTVSKIEINNKHGEGYIILAFFCTRIYTWVNGLRKPVCSRDWSALSPFFLRSYFSLRSLSIRFSLWIFVECTYEKCWIMPVRHFETFLKLFFSLSYFNFIVSNSSFFYVNIYGFTSRNLGESSISNSIVYVSPNKSWNRIHSWSSKWM